MLERKIFLIFGLNLLIGHVSCNCPTGWTEVPRRNVEHRYASEIECVMLHTEKEDWYRAKAICRSQESDILELNSEHESFHIQALTQKFKDFSTPYWIGGNDLATTGRWAWASNGYRIYPFTNWKDDRPNGSGHCVSVDPRTFQWSASPCDNLGYFFCEKKLIVEEVKEPEIFHGQISFDGSGYLELDKKLIAHDLDMMNELTLELSTWSQDGLILWQGKRESPEPNWYSGDEEEDEEELAEGNYIALGIEMGRIVYHVNKVKIEIPKYINDGEIHFVNITKRGTSVELIVDEIRKKISISPVDSRELQKNDLFLGGLPNTSPYDGVQSFTLGLFQHGYTGCIHSMSSVNNQVDNNARDGNSNDKSETYGGKVDFGDRHLNKLSLGVVSSDSCKLPPRSTSRPTFAPATTTTQAPTTITTTTSVTTTPVYYRRDVAFDGSSILEFRDNLLMFNRLSRGEAGEITIHVELTTSSPDGLLLWQGERVEGYLDNEYDGEFFAVAIVNGFVEVMYDFGTGQKEMTSKNELGDGRIDDGEKHIIDIKLYPLFSRLYIDNKLFGDQDMGKKFPTSGLFIGGTDLSGNLFEKSFYGCLHSISIYYDAQKNQISFDRDMVSPFGNRYLMCTSLTKPTTTSTTTTTTATTTKKRLVTTTQPTTTIRTTPPTTTEARCIHKEIGFGSNSFVRLRGKVIGEIGKDNEMRIDIKFSTTDTEGLLLWQGSTDIGKNWLSVGVLRGKVDLRMKYENKDPVVITSSSSVNDGRIHNIIIQKFPDYIRIQIDQLEPEEKEIPEHLNSLRFRGDLYVGGIPGNVYGITDGLFNKGFKGCIHKLEVNQYEPESFYGQVIQFEDDALVLERSGISCYKICKAT